MLFKKKVESSQDIKKARNLIKESRLKLNQCLEEQDLLLRFLNEVKEK